MNDVLGLKMSEIWAPDFWAPLVLSLKQNIVELNWDKGFEGT